MKNFLDDLIIELDKGIKSSLSSRQEYERAYPAESIHEVELNEFEKNNCAGTVFHGINIVIDSIDNNPETYHLLTLRSFGESLYHHVTDAALEFGYIAT